MKIQRLIISLIYATFLIKNAESVGEGGQGPKLFKTFDEIYGKGWDAEVPEFTETKEWHKMETQTTEVENKSTDQDNPNEQSFSDHFQSFANRKIRERFDEMFDENWSEDNNEFIEETEADSTDQNDCIDRQKCQKVQENVDCVTKLIKRRKNVYSDQQKHEIVGEFIKMKNEYKQKRKYSKKEWDQNNTQIAKSFSVGYRTILKWKKAFGQSQKLHSKQEKMEKLKQYYQIKKSNPKISAFEIAESLNISRYTLCRWKRELKNTASKMGNDCSLQNDFDQITQVKVYSDQQKREIVEEFIKLKNEYKQKGKYSKKEWNKNYTKISMTIGVRMNTIVKWKKEFGLSKSIKFYSKQERVEKLKQYCEFKRINPKMKEVEISGRLNIGESTLGQWKRELKNAVKNENNCSLQKELNQIGPYKVYSDQQKREIVEAFIKMSNEYKQKAKYSKKEWHQNYAQIANCFGVSIGTLWNWKKEFDLSQNYHTYSDKEKVEKLKQFFEIKKNNPKMPVSVIADLLNIPMRTLNRWKAKFMGIGINEKRAEEAADSIDHE